MLEEMLSGTVNGVTVTDQDLLLGGIMLQLPLAMALLSRLLPDRASRWANLVAALASVAIVLVPTLVTSTPDPDDLLFAAAELVGCCSSFSATTGRTGARRQEGKVIQQPQQEQPEPWSEQARPLWLLAAIPPGSPPATAPGSAP
jgi:hypothetical protein